MKPTYEIVTSPSSGWKGIKCLVCQRTSYNPNDVEHKYCGYCHQFHEVLIQVKALKSE